MIDRRTLNVGGGRGPCPCLGGSTNISAPALAYPQVRPIRLRVASPLPRFRASERSLRRRTRSTCSSPIARSSRPLAETRLAASGTVEAGAALLGDRDGQDGSEQISSNHGTFGSPAVAVVVGGAISRSRPSVVTPDLDSPATPDRSKRWATAPSATRIAHSPADSASLQKSRTRWKRPSRIARRRRRKAARGVARPGGCLWPSQASKRPRRLAARRAAKQRHGD